MKEIYNKLYSIKDLTNFTNQEALNHIASLIDMSFDINETDGLNLSLQLLDELQKKDLTSSQRAEIYYFLSNINHYLNVLKNDYKTSFVWKSDEIEKEIFYLRSAINEEEFNQLYLTRKCQILTNAGNYFSEIGRFVEAVEYWNKSLAEFPDFDMAKGNLGFGLFHYGKLLYDEGHTNVFMKFAHNILSGALESDQYLHDGAKKAFVDCKKQIESAYHPDYLNTPLNMTDYPMGSTDEEINYRSWCLTNKLFLNPLNDLGPYPIASYDIFTTPPIILSKDEAPTVPGLFNLIKQEYTSARYLYYDGIKSTNVHFSDKGVYLHNTLDYSSFSFAVEKIKTSFRISYSLFDKIAYLINYYFRLNIPEEKVTFKTLWYEKKNKEYSIREEIEKRENWPLRGLFWLSKDIYEKNTEFLSVMEPDAKEINTIRNHLEHKYLKIHEFEYKKPILKDRYHDDLAFHISRASFEIKTLKLLKLVRAAIIYLSLSIHVEEIYRAEKIDPKLIIMPIGGDAIDDSWKV